MFNELGYVEVGVREIARELQISPGNLSYHFSRKEDILFALLSDFSERNSQWYADYLGGQPTAGRFLQMLEHIFENQYHYRGVYIGNQVVQAEIQQKGGFDYQAVAEKRKETYRQIFEELHRAEQLTVREADISFLVSFITLFARFWITEAMLFNKSPEREPTIRHYLSLVAWQLSLFATARGMEEISPYYNG